MLAAAAGVAGLLFGPLQEEPGFWRRMGLATGKGLEGKGKGKGARRV